VGGPLSRLATRLTRSTPVRLSVVIPCLDEAAGIVATLDALRPLRERRHEVIVVDAAMTARTPSRGRAPTRCCGRRVAERCR